MTTGRSGSRKLEAAIRFCRPVFGAEYASLLAKAAEVAVQAVPLPRAQAGAGVNRCNHCLYGTAFGVAPNCRALVPIAAAFAP